MRSLFAVFLILMLVSAVLVVADDTEIAWFDTKECAFCAEVAKQPGLADHMRHEYHNISDGIVTVTYIDKDYRDEFANMQAGMQKVAGSMNPTSMPKMCGHCAKIGEFYMKGVKMEPVPSEEVIIFLYRSADTAMVRDIQAFGARCTEEFAKMKAAK
jgi:hypothetical protein